MHYSPKSSPLGYAKLSGCVPVFGTVRLPTKTHFTLSRFFKKNAIANKPLPHYRDFLLKVSAHGITAAVA
jgi:hypothetical protein